MKTLMLCLMLGGLTAAGCASPQRIRQAGYAHMEHARQLEAEGDYVGAAKERAAAQKQFRKAEVRAYNEASVGIYRY